MSEIQKRSSCHITVFAICLFLSVQTQAHYTRTTFSSANGHCDSICALQSPGQNLLIGTAVISEGEAPRHKGTHRNVCNCKSLIILSNSGAM